MADKQIQANVTGYPECGGGSASSYVVLAHSVANAADTGVDPTASLPTGALAISCPQAYTHVEVYVGSGDGDTIASTAAVYVLGKFKVQPRDALETNLGDRDHVWLPLRVYGGDESTDNTVVVLSTTAFSQDTGDQGSGNRVFRGPATFALDGADEIVCLPAGNCGTNSFLVAKLVLGV